MIAAIFREPGRLEISEVRTPEAGPGEVIVKVGANTVCGTDVRIMKGQKTSGVERGTILGHEVAGRIAQIGDGVEGYKLGDAVALTPVISCYGCYYCRRHMENLCLCKRVLGTVIDGGLAEYLRVPSEAVAAGNLFVAGEDMPPEHLALAEPLACCINGHENYRVNLDDTVLILGAGPIGLFHLQLALRAGANKVIVSDPSEVRRGFAAEFGAHVTVDPESEDLPQVVSEHTMGLGTDVSVICIGVPTLVNDALNMTRRGGRVSVFAGLSGSGWSEVEANLIHYNEISVTGASDSRRSDYEKALRLIESGGVDVERMVTERFPLTEASTAIESSAGGENIKVAVEPWR